MNPETLRIIDSIARDRNIDREVLIQDIEQAMMSAARKHFGSLDTEEFYCKMDRISGEIRLWRKLPAVYDEETGDLIAEEEEYEVDLVELGRIPAQTAKQVMIQRFREDERASIFEEFSKRLGELVSGAAQRYEGGALIVQIDRAEGFMPRSEQIPGEHFQPGDRVRCMILDVKDLGSQVKIVLSRANPDFIRRLFEVEVPEVTERIIEIKAMSREPGFRTKLAVASIDSKVDAVGACVGVRGSRIKNIVDELGGEKIDIVRWNESSQILIQNALKPAEVTDVSLCFELGRATVIVAEDQLSLAIGKRGQNVRLAARLTGWDIDILTPAEYAKGIETMVDTFKDLDGINEGIFDRLAALGIISVFDVEEVGPDILTQELEVTPELAAEMASAATERGKTVAVEQAKEREENEKRRAEERKLAESVLGGTAADATTAAELVDPSVTDAALAKSAETESQVAAILDPESSNKSASVVEPADEVVESGETDHAEPTNDDSTPFPESESEVHADGVVDFNGQEAETVSVAAETDTADEPNESDREGADSTDEKVKNESENAATA